MAEVEDEQFIDDELYWEQLQGKTALIYLIDADPKLTGNSELFTECLSCIESDMLKNVWMNSHKLASIVFYNTVHSPQPQDRDFKEQENDFLKPKHCAVLLPLKKLNRKSIANFKRFKSDDISLTEFPIKFGSSKENHFIDALWVCSRIFSRSNFKLASKTILIFTVNEQPYGRDSPQLQQIFMRAKDLCDMDIGVTVVPMVNDFDYNIFYKEFLSIVLDQDEGCIRCLPPAEQREKMKNLTVCRSHRQSCTRHLKWKLADAIEISCDAFSFNRKMVKPSHKKVTRDSNEVISTKRITAETVLVATTTAAVTDADIEQATTEMVLPTHVYNVYQEICGKYLMFTSEERTTLNSMFTPGIQLIGYKPFSCLQQRIFIRNCLFLYPNDDRIDGSSTLFRALWEKCLERKMYALCSIVMRSKGKPDYVALVPQEDEKNGRDGFKMIFLPTEDDFSYMEALEAPPVEASETMIRSFKNIVQKLMIKFEPDLFINPALYLLRSQIEAIVYDESEPESFDNTLPKVDKQDQRIEEYVDALRAELAELNFKRPNDGDGDAAPRKIQKQAKTIAEIENAVACGGAKELTVAELKSLLKSRNCALPNKAVKNDLISLAEQLF